MKTKGLLIITIGLIFLNEAWGQTTKQLAWNFPLTRVHTGMLLANGTQGLMVWGESDELRITIGRAGFWDHRGGNEFTTNIDYPKLKALLLQKDEEGIREAFAVDNKEHEAPNLGHPQQLGGGRLIVSLPAGWELKKGILDLAMARIRIEVSNGDEIASISIRQNPINETAVLKLADELRGARLKFIPAYEFVKEKYESVGIKAPEIEEGESSGIYTQNLPEDLPLSIGFERKEDEVFLISSLHQNAKVLVKALLAGASSAPLHQAADHWWSNYWNEVPKVVLPDPQLQEIYDYGLYKQACVTPPQGIASSLQGPFMEDYQLPPWSNDYHFNINIEMIYYPALMSGRFDHFKPLWKMIKGWEKELKKNGLAFFGNEDALMLPHAVDDSCKVVGTFWTGTIDHACTAWMAQLAWLHYAYSGDPKVLEETAYPLLLGAFEGFWAMLEEKDGTFSLPVSVSPEYRGSRMDAWGKDASFQLAALHAICQILPIASDALGKAADPRWKEVAKKLPAYTLVKGTVIDEWNIVNERIGLWEGMDLVESHRHHSHLGAIWPFVTIDPLSSEHKTIVNNSLGNWRYRGAGGWSGWCVPWASILMSRTNQAEAAVNWLHYWKDNFTNEGRGTLHNANTNGHSFLGAPVWSKYPDRKADEVMQLDAGFGALIAVYELLAQQRKDAIHIFPGLSIYWKEASFEDMWMEGGFKLSAKVKDGKVSEVKVKATRSGSLRINPNLGETYIVNGMAVDEEIYQSDAEAGQIWEMRRVED